MASYETQLKEQAYPPHHQHLVPQYPPPPDVNSPANAAFSDQLYPNTDPALQPSQPLAIHPAPITQQHASSSKAHKPQAFGEDSASKEVKNRLRKACDSCSIRKVKCDENSPCKACVTLEIPCTFDRPSKRRGPPNRHADAIKKQRTTDSPGQSGHPETAQPGSPTHAAHTLASFSQQQVLTIETIMPWPILSALVDDYFTFVHPLIPVPHEPSFRQALQRREDLENRTFLALVASMLGCLLASFPRRARQHLRTLNYEGYFPNSMSMVDRCRKVTVEAHGPASFQRKSTVHDAIITYLQGLTSAYIFELDTAFLYFNHCLAICTTIGLYRSTPTMTTVNGGIPTARMTANGQGLQGPQGPPEGDLVVQELGRRTFWIMYSSVKSFQQLGSFPFALDIAPATKTYPHPPLSLEVDDQFLNARQPYPQPQDMMPQLACFNINAQMASSYESISTGELINGIDEVFNWERQKAELEESLQKVKELLERLPPQLQLTSGLPPSSPSAPQDSSLDTQKPPTQHQPPTPFAQDGLNNRASIQLEIQKANIHTNALSIRAYLVKKYWTLRARRNAASTFAGGADDAQQQEQPSLASTSASALTEAAMTAERLDLTQDFLNLLASLSQVAVEPNGLSLIPKLRLVASILLGTMSTSTSPSDPKAHTSKGRKAQGKNSSTNDNGSGKRGSKRGGTTHESLFISSNEDNDEREDGQATQEEYLESFFTVLVRLEGVLPANENPGDLDEEGQLRAWADLWVAQESYVGAGERGRGGG